MTDINERVDQMVLDEFRADWRRNFLHSHAKWSQLTEDHHHLACCDARIVDRSDSTEEKLGGCAEGTCDVFTEITVGITCPHGCRTTHTYDSESMVDMVNRLLAEDTTRPS